MSFSSTILVVLLVLAIVGWRISIGTRATAPAPLPPGPPADPVIGHVRKVPSARAELCYQKWAKEYRSDVLYLNLMGQPTAILNSAQAAVDLMDKRSSIYSDRPDFNFFEESGWADSIAFMSIGPTFRRHRKMLQNAFSPTNIVQYREKQEALTYALLGQILRKPGQWRESITRFSSSLILAVTYGIKVTEENDPYLKLTDKMTWFFANGGPPGETFVDIVPFLRRLPSWVKIFPALNFARRSYSMVREFYENPFAFVKTSMANGNSDISFVRSMLEEVESSTSVDKTENITEDDIKGAAATLYAAGADTSLSTLAIFVLCMVLNPEIQEKAREGIDQVIGRDRLPNLSDRGTLPCVDRLLHETLRWHPAVPLGVPHRSNKDDVYRNMFIPKRSIVIANAYAILHDSSVYTNPETFNPDRYIPTSEGGLGEPLPVGPFGFGCRVCPGQHFATASVWIVIATLLATFKMSTALDDTGKEITPAPKMTSGLESHPEPFPCVVNPRDEQAVRLIQQVLKT